MSTSKRQMNRDLFDIMDINPKKMSWTALIQVVERHSPRENEAKTLYRNYVFTDTKGVKVGAVMFGQSIGFFEQKLLPYKRYYVSNAKVKKANPMYVVGQYGCSWTISKSTPVQSVDEDVPPLLPCTFDTMKFSDFRYHADKNTSLTVKALVIAAFPTIQVNATKTSKDFIVVNEEKLPMILRVWNELLDPTELRIPYNNEPMIIIATKLKVTTSTFDGLGLTLATKPSTYIMDNPPLNEDVSLLKWYTNNAAEIKMMLEEKAYKDASKLLTRPLESEFITLTEAVSKIETLKTAWVAGKIQMVPAQENMWYAACENCNQYMNADIGWELECTSCMMFTKIKLRCRMELFFTDGTSTIEVIMNTPEVEQLFPFSKDELKAAYKQAAMPVKEIEAAIHKKEVVCLMKYYDKKFRGSVVRTYPIVKLYENEQPNVVVPHAQPTPTEVLTVTRTPIESSQLNEIVQVSSASGVAAVQAAASATIGGLEKAIEEQAVKEKQFFSPTAKTIIDEISVSCASPTAVVGQISGVKRGLKFEGNKNIHEDICVLLRAISNRLIKK